MFNGLDMEKAFAGMLSSLPSLLWHIGCPWEQSPFFDCLRSVAPERCVNFDLIMYFSNLKMLQKERQGKGRGRGRTKKKRRELHVFSFGEICVMVDPCLW